MERTMANSMTRTLKLWIGTLAVASLGIATACTTDDSGSDNDEETGGGGTGGSGKGGTSSTGGSSGTGGGSSTELCSSPIVLTSSQKGIADFDTYDGSDISKWFFPLGGDSSSSVLAGPYGYGDEMDDKPQKFEMLEGHDSMYAVSVSDTLAEMYGGGVGLWLSECLDARAFTGISFWAKGDLPKGSTKLSLSMKETTLTTISGPKKGTCVGTDEGETATCVQPSYQVPVTADWTEFRIPWSMFTGGKAMGAAVPADGHDIWQIQFGIELNWLDDGTGTYAPTPAPYSLEVDDVNFY
jgi:hypothetical protein